MQLRIQNELYFIKNKKARELLALLTVYGGGPIRKLWAAEVLWPAAEQSQAMDSLYKVLRFWRRDPVLQTTFPLSCLHKELILQLPASFFCDLQTFESAASGGDMARMAAAVELYAGPLLFQEYYEWTAQREAFCELRQLEMLDALSSYCAAQGDSARSGYYQKKRELLQISN